MKNDLLEVAAVVTDSNLSELGVYESVIWHPKPVIENVSPFIRKMHGPGDPDEVSPPTLNLLDAVHWAKKEACDVERELLTFFHKNGVEPNEGILAGSSIHFDRRFLKENMPLLEAFFYHRMFDVSALKTAAQMWAPELIPPPPKAHRALADVRSSIALAKHFYWKLFAEPRRLADAVTDWLREDTYNNRDKVKDALVAIDPHWSTR